MTTAPAKTISRLGRGIALIATLCFAGISTAEEDGVYTNPDLIFDVEYGLVCDRSVVGSAEAPDTDMGLINIIEGETVFTTHGTLVPAIPGLSFGVKTRASGQDVNDAIFRVSHPPLKGTGTTKQSWQGYISATQYSAQLYSFDLPSELVTGTWTLAAYQGETLLYSIPFTVIPPADAPAYLKNLCNLDAYTS